MKAEAKSAGYTFPYLFDESQAVARAYGAACTPDFFLFDSDRRLVYRGQFDDSRPGNNKPITGSDLRGRLRRRPVRKTGPDGTESKHRLQHQVERGKRAGVFHGQTGGGMSRLRPVGRTLATTRT